MSKDLNFNNYLICLAAGENRLQADLEKLKQSLPDHQKFQIQVTGLHVGDVLIGRQDTNKQNPEYQPDEQTQQHIRDNFVTHIPENFQPLTLIERKTISDFASSFRSNHYHNQKSRMIAYRNQTNTQLGLVVEDFRGSLRHIRDLSLHDTKEKNKVNTIPISTLEQCFTSIQIRDHFFVQHVDNIQHHAQFLFQILKTIEKYQLYKEHYHQQTENITQDYQQSLKVKKKDNFTPELCYQIQLSSIPGISLQMAQTISQHYPNLQSLLDQLIQPLGWQKLEEVDLGKMKFGKVKAQRLHEYLLPNVPITLPQKKTRAKKQNKPTT